MQTLKNASAVALLIGLGALTAPAAQAFQAGGDDPAEAPKRTLDEAAAELADEVRATEKELAELRRGNTEALVGLRERVGELRQELLAAESANRDAQRLRNQDATELVTLTQRIDSKKKRSSSIGANLAQYIGNFEVRVNQVELQAYEDVIQAAKDAPGDDELTQTEVFARQLAVLEAGFDRIAAMTGGKILTGEALDPDGAVRKGTFYVLGPFAAFLSEDGTVAGPVVRGVNQGYPSVKRYPRPEDEVAARAAITGGSGMLPIDITGDKAIKIASTEDSLWEHIQKGGAIIYPILLMAALALLVALYKWISFLFVRKASRKQVSSVIAAVRDGDEDSAKRRVREVRGPVGEMLTAGVETMGRSRDLMEDTMFERVLDRKERLNKALPFISVCAASAPLLGLLGTVTGIINTFKQITVFGSGDVKSLSGGISEALITTKFGLIVAIPSLLIHAYLSRRARGFVTQMESNAVRFANEVARSETFGEPAEARRQVTYYGGGQVTPEHDVVRGQVSDILTDILGPLSNDPQTVSAPNAGGGESNGSHGNG